MTTKADSSAEAACKQEVPTIVCMQDDDAACAAVKGCCKLNRMFWDGGAAPDGPLQVLVAASEEALARRWPQLQGIDLRMIVLSDACFRDPVLDAAVFAYLPKETPIPHLERMIENALEDMTRNTLCRELAERLRVSSEEIDELNRIGVALSAEHRIPKLLEMILTKARQITAADAGSIYLVEPGPEAIPPRSAALPRAATGHSLPTVAGSDSNAHPSRLRFSWTQNDTLSLLPLEEMAVEISESSIAGYVAFTGEYVQLDDAYNPPPGLPFTINRSFDLKLGYHTKSILAVPMRNEKDEVVGVLQLMNCKREMAAKLTSYVAVSAQVRPFSAHHRELIMSLASQAAIALQNSRLLRSIETLFEGFVDASVIAIEERDPTTCGHSFRVAQLALVLAEAVNRVSTGPWAEIRFTPSQMKELRYAALLHDFGKVGVRENVLLKAAKLYPAQLELLRQRFQFAKRTAEAESLRQQLDFLLANGVSAHRSNAQQAEAGIREYWERLDRLWEAIEQANRSTLTSQRVCSELAEAASLGFTGVDGVPSALVTEEETRLLAIAQGSLDPEERTQIEAHVIYTERFLSQIPWTGDLQNVTAIAAGHHEKLNGTGYPRRLLAADIPVQTRIITIVDMFDALTASDRPYKKAVSTEDALHILRAEVNAGAIDANLFELFVELIREGTHAGELQEQSFFTTDRSAVA